MEKQNIGRKRSERTKMSNDGITGTLEREGIRMNKRDNKINFKN